MKGRIIFNVESPQLNDYRQRQALIDVVRAAYRKNVGGDYNAFFKEDNLLHSYTCFPVDDTHYLSEILYIVTTAVIGQDRHNVTVTVEVTEEEVPF